MPTYDYRCPNEHWTSEFRWQGHADDAPVCSECGEATVRGIRGKLREQSEAERVEIRRSRVELRMQGRVIRDAACTCGWSDDTLIIERREDGTLPDTVDCPDCNGQARLVAPDITPARDEMLKLEVGGGYFDRGAGRHFANKRERREWMKAGGWEEAPEDTNYSLEAAERRRDDNLRRDSAEWADTLDRYNHHPDFASYRRQRDAGGLRTTNHRR